jgi:hypothetical protein
MATGWSHSKEGDESVEEQALVGICRKSGQEDRTEPAKEPFWRKQKNAAKHAARLRS